jgi:hypothetical protein
MMPDKSPETIHQAPLDVGPLQVLSHFGDEYQRVADGRIKGFVPCRESGTRDI